MISFMTIKAQIKALAIELGYHSCGITGMLPFDDYRTALKQLSERFPDAASIYHGMDGASTPPPSRLWPNPSSLPYGVTGNTISLNPSLNRSGISEWDEMDRRSWALGSRA